MFTAHLNVFQWLKKIKISLEAKKILKSRPMDSFFPPYCLNLIINTLLRDIRTHYTRKLVILDDISPLLG